MPKKYGWFNGIAARYIELLLYCVKVLTKEQRNFGGTDNCSEIFNFCKVVLLFLLELKNLNTKI